MTEEAFVKMTDRIRSRRALAFFINVMDKLITMIVFLAYPMLLGYLYYTKSPFLVPAFAVPGVSFFLVTLFRRSYNAKRPYEIYDFDPVIKKNTIGKSFPSRHVFSIFIIAMTFMQIDVILGAWFLVAGALLAALRVFGGVHFIKDVIVGAAAGILAGCIGYYLIF
ncbi:MAG: phosphatase PAP2 family protein [Lachnospiraceae bacterium]|nr:phosphatase PAP2 family protein [Lachnospiraceae bacterium]